MVAYDLWREKDGRTGGHGVRAFLEEVRAFLDGVPAFLDEDRYLLDGVPAFLDEDRYLLDDVPAFLDEDRYALNGRKTKSTRAMSIGFRKGSPADM